MSRGTARRSIRVEDELWDEAQEEATRNGDNLSEIIRGGLRRYIEESKGFSK